MSIPYLLLIVIAIAGMIVQSKLQSVFSKYSKVPFAGGMTGKEVAEKMLRSNGINDVKVVSIPGRLTDNYNPIQKTVNLSEGVYNSNSISAAAVATHECGHAIQHALGYAPLKMRSALVPAIQITSRWAIWVILAGIVLMMNAGSPILFWVGIGMIGMSVIFSLITLPVEYNASARAMHWLKNTGMLQGEQIGQAQEALDWAARTYLVAAISSLVTLFYFLGLARRR